MRPAGHARPGPRLPERRSARERLGLSDGDTLRVQVGPAWQSLRVAGAVAAGGTPLAVMDIAGAQQALRPRRAAEPHRPAPRTRRAAPTHLRAGLPAGVRAVAPDDAAQNVSQLSRAYRVNLTVLALVALFVGAFLVYSVVALSVAQRSAGICAARRARHDGRRAARAGAAASAG